MAKRRPRRSDRTRQPQSSPGWRLAYPRTPWTLLTPEQLERLHQASLDILANTGVVFNHDGALRFFREAECHIDGSRVRLSRDYVNHALESVPSIYVLNSRNPDRSVSVGGDSIAVMPAGGPAFIYDLERQRRPGTLSDLKQLLRLAHMSPGIQVCGRKMVEATDIAVESRHLHCWHAALTFSDKPVQSGFTGGRAEAEDVLEMLGIVHGGEDQVRGTPRAQTNVNVNSPLQYDQAMLESLMTFAAWGQPVQITPFVMAGVSGPSTLMGAMAQHNAEILAGVVLSQLVNPGTPVLYGCATSNVDLRSGAPAIGSPESAVSAVMSTQLARFHGLPSRAGGALSDAPLPDQQSAYERSMLLTVSVLSGANFIMHGAGVLESYLTVSPAQWVMDLEILGMLDVMLTPISVSEDALALDTIDAVGPGGMFLDTDHTLARYRDVHFMPEISLRKTHEQWCSEGAVDTLTRAERRCREMLEGYVPPVLPSQVIGDLEDFLRSRNVSVNERG